MSQQARPTRRSPSTNHQGRWTAAALGIGSLILLLALANVQLWRLADEPTDSRADISTAPLPALPKSGSGNRALSRQIDQSQQEFRDALVGLENEVARASSTSPQVPKSFERQLDALTNQSSGIGKGLDGLQPDLSRLSGATPGVRQLPGRLDGVTKQLKAVERTGGRLRTLNERLGNLDPLPDKFDTLIAQTDLLLDQTDTLSGSAHTINGNVNSLGSKLDGLGLQMGGLQEQLVDMDETFESLVGPVSNFYVVVTETNDLLERLIEIQCNENPAAC